MSNKHFKSCSQCIVAFCWKYFRVNVNEFQLKSIASCNPVFVIAHILVKYRKCKTFRSSEEFVSDLLVTCFASSIPHAIPLEIDSFLASLYANGIIDCDSDPIDLDGLAFIGKRVHEEGSDKVLFNLKNIFRKKIHGSASKLVCNGLRTQRMDNNHIKRSTRVIEEYDPYNPYIPGLPVYTYRMPPPSIPPPPPALDINILQNILQQYLGK